MPSSGRPTAPTSPPSPATLPVERAFVVQLRADADLAGGVVRGRIEHLTSGLAAVFESMEELVAHMDAALRANGVPRPDPGK